MKILHLARDEKFVPLMQRLFDEALPGVNHWLIARKRRAAQRFVAASENVRFRPEWWLRTPLAGLDVRGADVIVAHSMPTIFAQAIRRAAPQTRVVWLGWGYDYYPALEPLLGGFILPQTRALAAGRAAALNEPGETARRKTLGIETVAQRIHTCSVLPSEIALLRQAVPALRAQLHEVPLFTAEDTFGHGGEMSGPDWLLGNSATASNNHAEALALLARHAGTGRVVIPLSYGDADYGSRVAQQAQALLGSRCDALREWMPLEDYNRRTAGCGFVLMNHRRQQAVGNLGAALYRGATVYLRRENPVYAYYRDLGVTLRTVDELEASTEPPQPITAEQRQRNREVIGAHYARERVLQMIRTLPALGR